MKKIVMFQGGVETLDFFSKEMAEQFRRMGYDVFFYDLKKETESAKKLKKFIKPKQTAMVTFNFEGLEKEPGVYSERDGYLWDAYGIPCYNIAADHPYFYDNRFRDLPRRYYHISIDRCQERYMREYYPEYASLGFLPLAGTCLWGTECAPETEDRSEIISRKMGQEREMDVIMTGNYTPLSFFEPYIQRMGEEYAAFYRGIIQDLINQPNQTVEEAAKRHCERELGAVSSRELRVVFHQMMFLDLYIRNYWRGLAVKTLAEAGITVDVVGNGWDQLECDRAECIRLHAQTDSRTCLKLLQNAKISLNVMPWFKDGAHDRVFNSIANGAVCVSDQSAYLCGELKEGEGVCYYELQRMPELVQKVKKLLADAGLRERILSKGMPIVLKQHLWAQRAEQLAEWIEEMG